MIDAATTKAICIRVVRGEALAPMLAEFNIKPEDARRDAEFRKAYEAARVQRVERQHADT